MKLLYVKKRQTVGGGIKGGGYGKREKGPFVTVIKHKKGGGCIFANQCSGSMVVDVATRKIVQSSACYG